MSRFTTHLGCTIRVGPHTWFGEPPDLKRTVLSLRMEQSDDGRYAEVLLTKVEVVQLRRMLEEQETR